jgi:hypothetical protein
VAYAVCTAIGLDANTASSDYIQVYDGKKKTLLDSLERVKEASTRILREVAISPAPKSLS